MFTKVKKEAAAAWWFLRCKFGAAAAHAAIPFATFALHRVKARGERDRTAKLAGMAAAAMMLAARFITPRVVTDAGDAVVNMQTAPRRGRGR